MAKGVKKIIKNFTVITILAFLSYTNFFYELSFGNLKMVDEASAAITYQTPGTIAYSAQNGTSVSPAYPVSIAAGDLLVLIIGMKPSVANGGSVTTPANWNPITSLTGAGGYGTTLGADTGNTNIFAFYKTADGTETGSLAVTVAQNNVSWAQMYRLSGGVGSTWQVAGATGSDTSAGSVSIAFGSNPGVTAGDFIIGAMVIPTDVSTPAQFSAEALSQSGITFGTVTEISEPDSTAGNDLGGVTYRAPVNSGTATGNPTFTATAGGTTTNVRGPGVFIRIREVVPANNSPTLTIIQPDGVGDSVSQGGTYNISYDLNDPEQTVTVDLYYDTDATGLNGTPIAACQNQPEGTGQTCGWDTTGVTPGTYYIYGRDVNDGIASEVSDYSSGAVDISAPLTLTIATTAGSQAANLNSGDEAQFINNTSCNGEASCSAFKLSASGGSVTVNSIKLTETGTVTANSNLLNAELVYDTDQNFSNGTSGTFGTSVNFAADQTVTFSNAGLTINSGESYYFYIKFDVGSSTIGYPSGGQTIGFSIANSNDVGTSGSPVKSGTAILSGTTTVRPQIIGYVNSTESALNYSGGCSSCGARIGPAASTRSQTIVISGYGFGSDPGAGNRDTATNKVEVVGASTHAFSDNGVGNTNVTAWSNTSITVTTDSNVTGDADANWGTNFGGSAALKVTAGNQAVPANLNFYLFPQVTSLTVCNSAGFPLGDNAREYSAADAACPNGLKDGEIILNGTRFGSSGSGGYVRILGCDSSTCSSPAGSVVTTVWSNTSITAEVPTVIPNNVYTGSIVMQQGSGSSNKSHTYTSTGFRVLPRISAVAPSSGSAGDSVTVSGDHLCQNNGVCPAGFSSANKLTFFDTVDASSFGSWSDSTLVALVPAGAASGNIGVLSNNHSSNPIDFTVLSPIPDVPTVLDQFKDSALSNPIATGNGSNSVPVYFGFIMSASQSGGTLYPEVEIQPIGTPFVCGAGACASVRTAAGKAGPGPIDCANPANNCFVTSSPADNIYHWQARVRHNKGGVDYFSSWVSFGGNSENATDFQIDRTIPNITFPNGNTCSGSLGSSITTNGATVSWNLSEGATGQVEYSTNSNMSGSSFTTLLSSATSHAAEVNNLNSNSTYYFRVRSVDASGNVAIRPSAPPYCSLQTGSVTQPAKTTVFYAAAYTGALTGLTTSTFMVVVPESSASVVSAYIEITGISADPGTNSITVGVNALPIRTYSIASGGSSFKIIYPVQNLNFSPATNELSITPTLSTNIVSAKVVVTYSYTP